MAVLRGWSASSILGGQTRPWYVIYVLGPDFLPVFVTDNLEGTDVTPPLYTLEVVDETGVGTWRLPKPNGLDAAAKEKLKRFIATPYKDLEDFE
jgi:hypothetical protein